MVITQFRGAYRFLSNFYMAPVKLGNAVYPSTEHAYQAAKTRSKKLRKRISQAKSAGTAKRLGQQVTIREDWEEIKVKVMYKVLVAKFTQHEDLKEQLLGTGDAELVEGNWWGDTFWGVCNNEGENKLGKLLMLVRDELQSEGDEDAK
jgi:ribA/ribD-fused uncharacterized protein